MADSMAEVADALEYCLGLEALKNFYEVWYFYYINWDTFYFLVVIAGQDCVLDLGLTTSAGELGIWGSQRHVLVNILVILEPPPSPGFVLFYFRKKMFKCINLTELKVSTK